MREIKFRAWDKTKREWVQKFVIHPNGSFEAFLTTDINNVDLMQYTGIKDKNGKEIYEGDIVKGREGVQIGEVKFGQYEDIKQQKHDNTLWHIGWYVQGKDRIYSLEELEWYIKTSNYAPFRGSYLEIIGNIYENTELLRITNKA